MPITRRGLGLGTAGLVGTTAFGAARAEEPLKWMTLAAHFYMVPPFCADTGIFARHGLNVDVGIATNAPTLLPAVVSGTIQVGVSTAIHVAIAREQGLDVVLLAGSSIQVRGVRNTAVLERPDGNFQKPSDFIGKRVVIPGRNGVFHVMFEKYLMDAGVDPNKVDYVEAGFAQAGDILRGGSADAALSTEPFLSRLVDAGTAKVAMEYWVPTQETIFDSCYICQGAWAKQHPDTVAALRASLRDGIAAMRADPAKMQQVEAKWLKLPPEVIARGGPPMSRIDIQPSEVQYWIDVAKQVGLVDKPPPVADMIAK